MPQVLSLGAEAAVAQRDVDVQLYFEREVSRLLLKPSSKDKIMALTREVGGLGSEGGGTRWGLLNHFTRHK